ncbi:MAG: glycoside hydrolase family 1 protein [Oligoflexia bacterium]|nr:glycoside hydrolase family 1 protein [Oligoflexia bacterium]
MLFLSFVVPNAVLNIAPKNILHFTHQFYRLFYSIFTVLTLLFIIHANINANANATVVSKNNYTFGKDFGWCTATAAHQIEGYNYNSDWWAFESIPGKIVNSDNSEFASKHWDMLEQDITLMKDLNLNSYRFSIEWAKIIPKKGQVNFGVIFHYLDELEKLAEKNITPIVTLQHFTLPKWVADEGGWTNENIVTYFKEYLEYVIPVFAPYVKYWVTINEPMGHLMAGYMAGVHPPAHKFDLKGIKSALVNLLKAHATAYHFIHQTYKQNSTSTSTSTSNPNPKLEKPMVGMAHHMRGAFPQKNNFVDRYLAKTVDYITNWAIPNALNDGIIQIKIPFLIDLYRHIDGLKGTQDYFGINYYTYDTVHLGFFKLCMGADEDDYTTEVGWAIYPEGMYDMLEEIHYRYPSLPIYITENGIADRNDRARSKFLIDHLRFVSKAIKDKIPVIGYCHWSLIDNFEWALGYFPRFGLYEVKYEEKFTRVPRASANLFAQIASKNQIDESMIDTYDKISYPEDMDHLYPKYNTKCYGLFGNKNIATSKEFKEFFKYIKAEAHERGESIE